MSTIAKSLEYKIDNEELLYNYMLFVRHSISIDENPPIDLIVKLGFVPKFAALLTIPNEKIQYEIAWAVTNIAADKTENCTLIRKSGSPKILVSLLDKDKLELSEQVLNCCFNR